MIEKNDWRLMGQEKYLKNATLFYVNYEKPNLEWDHDHCEFCMEKFSDDENDLHRGYRTADDYRWICEDCFNDFKEMFEWKVIN